MKTRDGQQVDAIIGSPPYAESLNNGQHGIDPTKGWQATNRPKSVGKSRERLTDYTGYGHSAGQLGALPAGPAPTPEDAMTTVAVDTWEKCYGETWKGLLTPSSFAHPAKVARGLASRIYSHLALPPGSVVLDPFGGICGFALDALLGGLTWIGVELETKFVELGNANLDWWRERWGRTAGFGQATLLCGDSRRLREVVGPVMVACAPLADVVCSSPPYVGSKPDHWTEADRAKYDELVRQGKAKGHVNGTALNAFREATHYGHTEGQLAKMPAGTPPGEADAVVSSPPYEGTFDHDRGGGNKRTEYSGNGGPIPPRGYSASPDNLGNATGATFWEASAAIVRECFCLLKPGGVAVWVVKDFVRDGARVPFADQWRSLTEAAGLVTVHEHHALLVEDLGTEGGLFEPPVRRKRERKSFFRRLHEKRPGAVRIDHETVLCQRKPT